MEEIQFDGDCPAVDQSPVLPSSPLFASSRTIVKRACKRVHMKHSTFFWPSFIPLILLSGLLMNWAVLIPAVFAASKPTSAPGHMTFQQFLHEGQHAKAPHGPLVMPVPKPSTKHQGTSQTQASSMQLPSAEPPTMHALALGLSSTQTSAALARSASVQPTHLKGNDGRLEVLVPAGSLDISRATTLQGTKPTGTLTLQVTQLYGHFIGLLNVLGAYRFQVVDAAGHVVQGIVLRQPLTLIYHYKPKELQDLQLDPDRLFVIWPVVQISPGAQATPAVHTQTQTPSAGGQPQSQALPMTNDAQQHTLTTQVSGALASPATASVGTSFADDQSPPKPNFASVQGDSGNLGYSYPIQMAPGPGGFLPSLQFTYSTSVPNNQHSSVQPAGSEGEGWNIGLGSITGGAQGYAISGVDSVSDRLIPMPGQSGFYETEHISHLRIQQVTSGATGQPCFHVWSLAGDYSELGCTSDSLQYYTTALGRINYRWDQDELVVAGPPHALQKKITTSYQQDLVTSNGLTSIRDAAIARILYGYVPAGGSFVTVGTVEFLYRAPYTSASSNGLGEKFATSYGNNYQCSSPPATTSLRCDDPLANGAALPPTVMSTMLLQKVETFVGDDSSSSHLDYSYALDYQMSPYRTCYDAYYQTPLYCAGDLDLTSLTPTAYLQGTAHQLRPVSFGYTGNVQNLYTDTTQTIYNSSSYYGGQTWWKYLNSYYDGNTGVGEHISYATAWDNTHGTPNVTNTQGQVIDDRHDPLFCDTYTTCTGTYGYPNDRVWTVQVVTQIQNWGIDSSVSSLHPATTTYAYQMAVTNNVCPPADSDTDCVGYTWLPPSDSNWMNYYNGQFMGFAAVYITSPAGDLTVQHYTGTNRWGSSDSDPLNYLAGQLLDEEVYSGNSTTGPLLQQITNAYAGQSGTNTPIACDTAVTGTYIPCEAVLLSTQKSLYEGTNPGTPVLQSGTPTVMDSYTYDDYNPSASGTGLQTGSGHYHNLVQDQESELVPCGSTSNCGALAPPYKFNTVLTQKWTYQTNDQTVNNWVYHDVNKVASSEIDDSSGHIWQCSTTTYDEGVAAGVPTPSEGLPTTVNMYSSANCAGKTNPLTTTFTGYDSAGNAVATVDALGTANPGLYSTHGCTLASAPVYLSSAWTAGRYTSCSVYDSFAAQAVQTTNAFGQSTSLVYDSSQQDLPTSSTDANGQVTGAAYSYDSTGRRTVQVKLPQEAGSYTHQSTLSSTCTTSNTLPCFEEDTNTSLYSSAVSRTFYDEQGRVVETRTPGPTSGDDTVVMIIYNDQLHTVWKSVPFQVASGSSWLDPNGATDSNGVAPAGTVTFYDALGRAIATQDPNFGSTQESGIACSATLSGNYTSCVNYSVDVYASFPGTGVAPTYNELITSIDPDGHVTKSFMDALGHTLDSRSYTGIFGGTLTLVKVTAMVYNVLDKPTSVIVTDKVPQSGQTTTSVTTTMTYDDLGQLLTVSDPDQGTFTYSYDPDGHVLSLVQTSGSSSRTIGYDYDLLGRVGCEAAAVQTTISWSGSCSGGSSLVRNTYDSTRLGTQGSTDFPVGQLTQTVAFTYYPDGSRSTVTQQYQHDQRGRLIAQNLQIAVPTGWNVTTALPTAQLTQLYNDANQPTTTSTSAGSAGYTFTQVYDATTGTLTGLSNNGGSTANLATLTYNEHAQISGITLLNGAASSPASIASEGFSYDGNLRPTSLTATWLSGSGNSGQILGNSRTFDNASNVTSVSTTLAAVPGQSGSGGMELQNFCYDEQNRLLWSGNGGTQPGAGNGTCGSGTLSNTLSGAGYTAPFTYTNLGQLWQGPLNGQGAVQQYLYCDASHPHQVTGLYPTGTTCASRGSATAVYSASYDPWGNQSRRTYNGVTATLSYDQFNRLAQWDAGSNGQEQYVYDVSGHRVLKRSTSGGTTSLTAYAFGLQELSYTGNGVANGQINYYSLAGHLIGSTDGSNTTFYLTDAQGSVLTSISQSAVLGEQVYGPYGNQRYVQGTLGTDKGYTGQFHDSVTGLDYYNARYYDPVVGMFVSPDSVQGNAQGMDPYAYVAGNPESRTDPTGHRVIEPGSGGPTEGGSCSSNEHPVSGGCAPNTGPGSGSLVCTGGQIPQEGKCVAPPSNSNDCKAAGKTLQGGRCVAPPPPVCDAKCRQHDIDLLLARQNAANAIGSDWAAIISAIAGLLLDWGNVLALIQDVISDVPLVTKLIGDYITASGGVIPGIIADIQLVFTMLSGLGNLLKSYSYLVWAISGLANPVLGLAKPIILKYAGQGLSALGSGLGSLFSLSSSDQDFSVLSNSQIQAQCQTVYHIAGCQ
ncbi:MAG TPA: RHS repeat-associated core domain-containing protein [Ktedonobacteraceae bacterium]|nr:RHS repeat-associated core domain-containing protein [Ktedonobacteraceae bacterium]